MLFVKMAEVNIFTVQLKDLLTRSIDAWVNLFGEADKRFLPLLRMELIFEDNKMQFYPQHVDLVELVLFVITKITETLQAVSLLPCSDLPSC